MHNHNFNSQDERSRKNVTKIKSLLLFTITYYRGVHPKVEMTHVASLKFQGGGNRLKFCLM